MWLEGAHMHLLAHLKNTHRFMNMDFVHVGEVTVSC